MLNETNVQTTESTPTAASKPSKTSKPSKPSNPNANTTDTINKRDSAELLTIVNQALAVFSMNAKDSAIVTICALYEADTTTRATIERIASSAKYKRNYDKYRSTLIAIFDFARVDSKAFNAIFAGTEMTTIDGLPDYSAAAKKVWKIAESWINLQSNDGFLFMNAVQAANTARDKAAKK